MLIKHLSMSLFSYSKKNTANQNIVLNKYFILIGQYWSTSTTIILEIFMTVKSQKFEQMVIRTISFKQT